MAELEDLGAKLVLLGDRVNVLVRLSEGLSERVLSAIQETSILVASLCGHHEEVKHFYRLRTARHNFTGVSRVRLSRLRNRKNGVYTDT